MTVLIGALTGCASKAERASDEETSGPTDSVFTIPDTASPEGSDIPDRDGDGYGDIAYGGEDCDDDNWSINPGESEIPYNGINDDCDPDTPDDDLDGDGYRTIDDCDDADPDFHPGAEEDCTEPIDYNCDGYLEYSDLDGDGTAACQDCNDANADQALGLDELCDSIDNDCDGAIDEDPTTPETFYEDADGDGYGDSASTIDACAVPLGYVTASADSYDCDDASRTIYPGAPEICNGQDEDCDAAIDESEEGWFSDDDSDGYGAGDLASTTCDGTSEHSAVSDDCDDRTPETYPGAAELCDGSRNNCDDSDWRDDDGTVTFYSSDGRWRDDTPIWNTGIASHPATPLYDQPGTVRVCSGTWYLNVTAAADLTLRGVSTRESTIDGAALGPVVAIHTDDITVDLQDLTLTNGGGRPLELEDSIGPLMSGGALFCDAQATVNGSELAFEEHQLEQCGGIALWSCDAELEDIVFSDNSSDESHGGGLCAIDSYLTLIDAEFSSNTALTGGGAYLEDSVVSMEEVNFSYNTATSSGGGLLVDSSYITLTDAYFSFNTLLSTDGEGGALYLSTSTTRLEESELLFNNAPRGGGVFQRSGDTQLIDTNWHDNTENDYQSDAYSYSWSGRYSGACDDDDCVQD